MAVFDLNELDAIKGKVVIVTGSNSGIGFEIAKILSSKHAKVIIACRNEEKGLKAQELIDGNSQYINLDLGSFRSVYQFVETVSIKYPAVDVLINNAGVMGPPFSVTENKLELTFGVNYIGYYLLTNMIMPIMKAVEGSRVINMSSIAQYQIKEIDWKNINSRLKYSKHEAYALSNLFRMMFTIELEEKLRIKNYRTIALSCHPGVTMTNLTRYMPRIVRNSLITKLLNYAVFQTPFQGAMTALMAATSNNVKGGDFVGLNTRRQIKGKPQVVQPNELVFDRSLREQLWDLSVEITGVDLG